MKRCSIHIRDRSPPYRRLRKLPKPKFKAKLRSPPYRRLRKIGNGSIVHIFCSPPYRRLRNDRSART